ncbi:LuxR C-terminal-related transcriptional regulator [Streptomyces sp. NPDC088554]|uniref:LuxR C-terminal-related transcriptional regulator n=1 Tax=Streptomyces sp. NPDC088554 TaxID=3365865 RepID=UPI00380ACADE
MGSLLAECERGRAMTVILEGGAGCGKTDLVEGFAQYAKGSGAVVLAARDIDFSSDFPAGPTTTADSVWFQKSCDHIETLAEHAPVVICLDDPRGYEEPNRRRLLEATRRQLRNSRVMLVLTLLPFGGSDGWDVHCELLRQPNLHWIRLLPLDRGQTAVLWDSLHGAPEGGPHGELHDGPPGTALSEELHAASGGNPLLVRALAEERDMNGRFAHRTAWPCSGGLFAQVALDCVRDSGPLAASVALGMAALREFSSRENLAAVLRLDPAQVTRGENVLYLAGLVDAWRLRHPVIESAVLKHPGFGQRSDILLRVAELLREHGAGARVTARYLLDIGGVAASWQAAILQRAADEALAIDDASFADACLALALDASTDCWERARLALKRSVVMLRTEPWRAEEQYLETTGTGCACGAERCDAQAVLRARLLIGCGRVGEGTEMLRAVAPPPRDTLRDVPHPSHFDETWPWLFCVTPGVPDAWSVWIPSGGTASEKDGGGGARADEDRFSFCLGRQHDRIRGVHEIEEQLTASRLGDTTLALIMPELWHLSAVGRPDLADEWCAHFLREATDRGVEGWRQLLTAIKAEIALARGALADAEILAREAVEHGGTVPGYWLCGGPLTTLITVCTATGRYEEAARLLGRPLPDAFFRSIYGLGYLRARGHFLLAVGRPHLALSDFLTVGRRSDGWDLPFAARPPWRIDAAEAWLRLGNEHEASQLLAAHQARTAEGESPSGPWLRVRARLAEPHERPGLLTRSAERFQASGNVWELTRVLADLAEAYQHLDQPAHADLTLRKARQLADEGGAGPLRERILSLGLGGRSAPRAARGPVHRIDPAAKLSESERRVAVLAARGLTNREISTELFITISTVEQHLTRVYKKLDIASRQELPLYLELGLPETA